ncbi:hypothetical protein GOBAR_DD12217 [Gossypium barbadense]|nr:hypothetical protein GOBAR_DD12217 [Gossypium barbadense]
MEWKTRVQRFLVHLLIRGRLCTILTSISTLDVRTSMVVDPHRHGLKTHTMLLYKYIQSLLRLIDEGADDENDYTPLVENPSRDIVIRNGPKAHMLIIDPGAAHAFEILEYPNVIFVHLMLADPKSKELFVGQRFARKDKCVAAIKRYNMKVAGTSYIYPEVQIVGDTEICWALYMHAYTYDAGPPQA